MPRGDESVGLTTRTPGNDVNIDILPIKKQWKSLVSGHQNIKPHFLRPELKIADPKGCNKRPVKKKLKQELLHINFSSTENVQKFGQSCFKHTILDAADKKRVSTHTGSGPTSRTCTVPVLPSPGQAYDASQLHFLYLSAENEIHVYAAPHQSERTGIEMNRTTNAACICLQHIGCTIQYCVYRYSDVYISMHDNKGIQREKRR